jgi:hypothetical protein
MKCGDNEQKETQLPIQMDIETELRFGRPYEINPGTQFIKDESYIQNST